VHLKSQTLLSAKFKNDVEKYSVVACKFVTRDIILGQARTRAYAYVRYVNICRLLMEETHPLGS
jgi:hypothetical protein